MSTRVIALEEAFTFAPFHDQESALVAAINPEWGRYVDERIADLTDLRLAEMDAAGVDMQVLSLTSPGIQGMSDATAAVRVAQQANDLVARVVEEHPARFTALAALPTQDPAASVAELTRSITDLGLRGALINGHTDGVYLDDPRFERLWAHAEALQAPIYIHPADPPKPFAVCAGYPLQEAAFGWAFETGTQVLRLALAGVFDRFPGVTVIVGHMGEFLPYSLARLDDRIDFYVADYSLPHPPSHYIRRNVMVTTSGVNDTAPLRCAIDAMGADRVMFAVDYPYQRNEPAVEFILGASLSADERELICHGNAERVLRLT